MSSRIFVATRKGLFTVRRSNSHASGWEVAQAAFVGDPVTMFMRDPRDGRQYAALRHGHFGVKLHASSDDGRTWNETTTPVYPEKPADVEDVIDPMRNKPIPWTLDMIWSLAAAGADQPGVLWCGTLPGGLFRSDDHGKSWSLNRFLWETPARRSWFGGGFDLPGIHSICVHPQDSNRVTVGVSCGGAWVTENGGETWENRTKGMYANYMPPEQRENPDIQDPHLVAQCRSNPDALWAQHHNGVFRSTDAGRQWHDIPSAGPSTFGFAVAVHPNDGDTAWLVPALSDEKRVPVDGKVVVTRTRDGGKTFDTLRSGLPQTNAYDLTFRHALDVDETGDLLAFGSTTGSLWISEDQGDTWRTVTTNLPPVYCVDFDKSGA